MREMIYKKIGKVSDIENVMRYFNINQVEKERYYEEIHTKKKRYDEKRYYKEEYVQERRKTSTNEKRYT